MADNFDMKKFLVENKLGPYAKNPVVENQYDDEDEDYDLNAAFKASPMSHSYEDVLDIFESYEDESILNDFKAKFPEGKDISRKDYSDFAMSMIDDMSEVAFIKANWISLTDDDVYTKAGLVEEKEKLAKEDLDKDRTDAEAEKMMDFLAEKDKEELKEFEEPIMQLINDPETLKTFLMSAAKLGGIGVGISGLLKVYAKYIASKLKKDPKYADKSSQELEKMAGQALAGKVQASAGGTGGGFLAEDDSQIDEALSPEAIDRMEGEANEQALRNLQSSLSILVPDWLEEGMFDEDDVADYLIYLMRQSY